MVNFFKEMMNKKRKKETEKEQTKEEEKMFVGRRHDVTVNVVYYPKVLNLNEEFEVGIMWKRGILVRSFVREERQVLAVSRTQSPRQNFGIVQIFGGKRTL